MSIVQESFGARCNFHRLVSKFLSLNCSYSVAYPFRMHVSLITAFSVICEWQLFYVNLLYTWQSLFSLNCCSTLRLPSFRVSVYTVIHFLIFQIFLSTSHRSFHPISTAYRAFISRLFLRNPTGRKHDYLATSFKSISTIHGANVRLDYNMKA